MFRCEITGRLSRRGDPRIGEYVHIDELDGSSGEGIHASEKVQRIVVASRSKIYKKRIFNETTRQAEDIEVGRGVEIVKEVNATQAGLVLWNSWSPSQQAAWVKTKFGIEVGV
jgi:hypothetical protein